MEKERQLYHQISSLQLQMLNFNQRISPIKGTEPKEESIKPVKIGQTKKKLLSKILLPVICISNIFLFPSIVFSIEGYCPLFWQSITVSSVLTILLMAISTIYQSTSLFHKITQCIGHNKVTIIVQDTDSINNTNKIPWILTGMTLVNALSLCTWASLENIPALLNVSLAVAAFISGILCVKVYTNWCRSQHLPYVNPHQKKSDTEVRSGPSSRRELDFSKMEKESPSTLVPLKCFSLTREASIEENLLDLHLLGVAPLPLGSPNAQQECTPSINRYSPRKFGFS